LCGIVGYAGRRDAAGVLIDGLNKLEYRGYDSFGIATSDDGIHIVKKQGRISENGSSVSGLTGHIGIGHTRWATHGVPDDKNAHPHTCCTGDIAIVHNGIISNYAKLKRELIAGGHIFSSDTDSEVIAHLIEENLNGSLLEAVNDTVQILEGSYAFLAMSKDDPGIIAARMESPLVLGLGDGEIFASSDMTTILDYTQNIVFLEDGDIASVSSDKIIIFNSGNQVEREAEIVEWDAGAARMGGFAHFMEKEIYEQPRVFFDTLASVEDGEIIEEIRRSSGLRVIACGSSYHAGLIFRYMMEECSDIPVRVDLASEFRYFRPVSGELVIAVTQSGETADTIAALKQAQMHNCRTLAITNVLGSSVTRVADYTLYMRAGPEISVAATKSFIAQLAVFFQIVNHLCDGMYTNMDKICHQVIEEVLLLDMGDAVSLCSGAGSLFFVGRSVFYPVSLEGALKMKEITYIHAEGYAAGELKHGPFSLLSKDTPVIAVCTSGNSRTAMLSNIREIKTRGAPVIGIGEVDDPDLEDIVDVLIPIPKSPVSGQILAVTVLMQVLAYRTAKVLGRDIDKPRNLAKSVTVE